MTPIDGMLCFQQGWRGGLRRGCANFAAAVGLVLTSVAAAQWNPPTAQWNKSHSTDLRVMTWNVEDDIRSNANKLEGYTAWTAMARIVAALKPDILVVQELGDHGTSGGVDSVPVLTTTINLFVNGGVDPYTAGNPQVTAYVRKYAPNVSLPYVFVSSETDGFNRNAIVSRFPFADLNGDTRLTINDIPNVTADLYAPGGDGGIRGFAFAEIDLPDLFYRGDLVMGNGHLKSGGASSDLADRLRASQNIGYMIDYLLNGGGTLTPDPHQRIFDFPEVQTILDPFTPVILGGDWNEDEVTNGRRGPADWMTQAQTLNGIDGTDRDRTDASIDGALHPFTNSRATHGSTNKLDYISFQDSIAHRRRAFVFNTTGTPGASLPPELAGLLFPANASGIASDHRPVIADIILPLIDDIDFDGDVDIDDFVSFNNCLSGPGVSAEDECFVHDADGDEDVDVLDFGRLMIAWSHPL